MIATERLLLRPWEERDRMPFRTMCASPAVMAHLGGPMAVEAVDAAIDRTRAMQRGHGHCFWAIERRSDGAFLGFCGLKVAGGVGALDGEIEIGWRLREEAWGQGYAREAAQASLDWGWASLPAMRIVAFTVPANRASWGLMVRLGMERRADLDFAHPAFPAGHPLSGHIVHSARRPDRN